MKAAFKSRDYSFRPTTLSSAMQAAGLIDTPHLVREAKREGTLRARHDRFNCGKSVNIPNIPADVRPPKEAWKGAAK